MIEATCSKCGAYYCGWALLNQRHQTCTKCGTALEITEGGRSLSKGYSPFTAERHSITTPTDVTPPPGKGKGKQRRNR